ncbi:hypothetical protein BC624_105128 [Flavobacterium granuli]|uniref:Uncharacterized protein n=1 Tax=Flavobacterium granuli TaxID=280093 RepID=A0A1M5NUU6_9FLAO|nr:hypothetical protein BC624_105128 [Flavobacterium granuli]SHG93311.1 hypothetical protein SAMN05443373_105128 [Flavobacterium granuli]
MSFSHDLNILRELDVSNNIYYYGKSSIRTAYFCRMRNSVSNFHSQLKKNTQIRICNLISILLNEPL